MYMAIYVHDSLNFLSKIRIIKIWNACKVFSSFYFSKWTKLPLQWGKPFTISFEPTTACNLRCPECPSGLRSFTRPTGNLKHDFFRDAIDQMASHLCYLIFYFQGEPYINPEFLDMVSYAHKKGIYTISSTNGHFLTEENARKTIESGLDRLIISIDGSTQQVYEKYRKGGQIEKVISGAKTIVEWRKKLKSKKPHLIFQFLVVKPNEHQIDEIYSLAKEIGVDEVKLKTAQVYDYKNGNPLIPSIEKFSRYKKLSDGTYSLKNKLLNHCWKLWHACVITWDGKVVPCCFDKDASHEMGDLRQQSFHEIWNNKVYKGFRRKILQSRKKIEICTNCSEGCTVWSE